MEWEWDSVARYDFRTARWRFSVRHAWAGTSPAAACGVQLVAGQTRSSTGTGVRCKACFRAATGYNAREFARQMKARASVPKDNPKDIDLTGPQVLALGAVLRGEPVRR